MKRRFIVAFGCLSCWCGFSAFSPPPVVAVPAQADSAFNSALEEGGNKLAADDTQGAIRSLQAALRAEPDNAEAGRLLSIAYLHARQHDQAGDVAESVLKQPSLTPGQRAVASLLLGKARYESFLDDYVKCTSQMGTLPDMAQLLSQMATHKFSTARGDVIITQGDVNAQDDFNTATTTFHDAVTRMQRRLDQADAAYKAALATDRHLAGIHDGLGLVCAAQGYPGEARHEFLTEIAQNGPSGAVYMHIGNLDASERHDDDAIDNLRRAVALAPEMAAPYQDLIPLYVKAHDQEHAQWARGMSALRRSDLKGAEAAFAIPSPKTCDLLSGQAQLYLTQKRTVDARMLLNKAFNLDRRDVGTAVLLGDLAESTGDYDQALGFYHQALDFEVACDAAWYGIGLVYDQQNNRDSALADYAQALQANPNNASARLNLAADEADLGQTVKALENLRDYEERFPTANNIYAIETALRQLVSKSGRN